MRWATRKGDGAYCSDLETGEIGNPGLIAFGIQHEMDFPERPDVKAPGGLNIPLGPLRSAIPELTFLHKRSTKSSRLKDGGFLHSNGRNREPSLTPNVS
jgi:hypothetical protein